MNDLDDLSRPLNRPVNPTLASQPPQRRWSLETLKAAQPNPKFATRAAALEWNRQYHDIPGVQVNPADYAESQVERSPEAIEENLKWLRDWGNGTQRPRPF